MTVEEAQKYLRRKGLKWTQVWMRRLISKGELKSEKIYTSRVIPVTELDRIFKDRKESKASVRASARSR